MALLNYVGKIVGDIPNGISSAARERWSGFPCQGPTDYKRMLQEVGVTKAHLQGRILEIVTAKDHRWRLFKTPRRAWYNAVTLSRLAVKEK